jgi:hypothetical protein
MLWMKQLILWMKLFLWMKTLLFGVMDQMVTLWMRQQSLWKEKIPALEFPSAALDQCRRAFIAYVSVVFLILSIYDENQCLNGNCISEVFVLPHFSAKTAHLTLLV